ncbi:MAG TPA: 1,2-phenylacetyl-CoA epoxidase subunit PaaE [Saprospiraceae bacterium]|nr:1,2-phenylacetyl-CoA epoxidase subunit PaaE [Saprospiraceae bacterium]
MSQFHQIPVREIRRETDDTVSIALNVPDAIKEEFTYLPGQYLTIKADINGEEVRRSYSLCSSPHEGEWRVAVKKVEQGRFSTYANEALKEGDVLEVMPPMGNFVVKTDEGHQKTYAAFAAGSGITPVMSIMKSVLMEEPESNFLLFYGNRNTNSIIFKEQIQQLKDQYMERLSVYNVLSREKQNGELFYGRITPDKCDLFTKQLIDLQEVDEFYFCGPGDMVQNLQDHFIACGANRDQTHAELFTAPDDVQKPPVTVKASEDENSEECQVSVVLDNHKYAFELEYDTNNILDAAIEQGVDLPYSCKGGVCSTCRAKVTKGEVQMMVNYALEPEEVEEGYVLTCQSYPKSASVEIDFDQ